jgi:callose synthase
MYGDSSLSSKLLVNVIILGGKCAGLIVSIFFLQIAQAIRPILEPLRMYGIVRSGFRLYDAMMGAVIFTPIAILSWFPFVSTFQTRLVFNQAFSRGLEISLILAGNRPNVM